MGGLLVPTQTEERRLSLSAAEQATIEYVSQAKSANTLRAYQSDWHHFCD
jgi:hypothetical protein